LELRAFDPTRWGDRKVKAIICLIRWLYSKNSASWSSGQSHWAVAWAGKAQPGRHNGHQVGPIRIGQPDTYLRFQLFVVNVAGNQKVDYASELAILIRQRNQGCTFASRRWPLQLVNAEVHLQGT
jgi:hypothetical protein